MYKYSGHLINEKLININPLSSSLTSEEKRMILLECKTNYSYFIHLLILKRRQDDVNTQQKNIEIYTS